MRVSKFNTLKVTIILSTLLSFFAVKIPALISFSYVTLYLSAFAGYAGIMLLLWTFILGTRSVISLFTTDYIKVIKLHSFIAKYGTLLIFIHPLLVMLSYGKSLDFILAPNYTSIFESAITLGRAAFFIILIIWLSSVFLKKKVSNRPWKYLHLASYVAIPFSLLHIPDTGSSFNALISAKIYFLIVTLGFLEFGLLRLRGALNLNKTKYKIISNQQSAKDIFTVIIKPLSKPIKINPGQYIYIKFGFFSEDHPFTVLDYNPATNQMIIGYKVYGKFTQKLSNLAPGTDLLISGPFGNFTADIDQRPVVFIAGGIGITPFMSRIIHESNNREQWLFYTNQNLESSAYLETIKKTNTKLVQIFTRQKICDCETSHVNLQMIKKYIPNPQNYTYYICGPESMTRCLVTDLTKANIPKNKIHYEIFNF